MDREKAIEVLNEYRKYAKFIFRVDEDKGTVEELAVALDLAIEALKGDLHCPKCGTIVRDGRQYHDLVYRGEAEPCKGDAETATTTDCISRADTIKAICAECTQEGYDECREDCTEVAVVKGMPPVNQKQITGKLESVENATSEGEESTMNQPKSKLESDLISRQAAIELACWRCKKCEKKDCEYKDSCETMRLLDALPSEDPKPLTPTERTGECEKCHNQKLIKAIENRSKQNRADIRIIKARLGGDTE